MLGLVGCNGRRDDTGDSAETDAAADGLCATCGSDIDGVALRVCSGGDDAGDGSADRPFATLEAGLAAVRETEADVLLIGAGTWTEQLLLDADDSEIVVQGCGVDETMLDGTGVDGPVVRFSGTKNATLTDMTLRGGRRSLWAWQGATVAVERVRVEESLRMGLIVHGAETWVTAEDLDIVDPLPDVESSSDDALGYGAYVEDGVLSWTRGGVSGATGLGAFVRVKNVASPAAPSTFTDIEILATNKDTDGRLGRGLMVQNLAQAEVVGGIFADNADAAIFGLRSAWLSVSDATVSGTRAADIPGGGTSGDGIVVTRGDAATSASLYGALVTGTTVSGNDRAGMLFDGVTVAGLNGNALDGNMEVNGVQILLQNGTEVTSAVDTTVELPGVDSLIIYDTDLEIVMTE
jgi:hypothetical protein